jgi:glycosyltransferase involved in cell wall biosynthesis
MTLQTIPKVSIGLPVYNGENFVAEAIECYLAQTFTDFELVISDNASTDRTAEICQSYAAKDERIRYTRNAENIGLTRNYNQVFTLSSGGYFKWADHDDLCRETFLAKCVQILDENPTVVLAYSHALTIDADGRPIKQWAPRPELTVPQVEARVSRALKKDEPFPQQGLIRAEVLKKTGLLGRFPESDHVLLAEISLYGPFVEIPEALFLVREHQQRTIRTHNWQDPKSVLAWLDPTTLKKSFVLPEWYLVADLVSAIRRAPLSWQARLRCYGEVYDWAKSRKDGLARDLVGAAAKAPGVGQLIKRSYQKWLLSTWKASLRRSAKDVASVVPLRSRFILVDDAMCPTDVFGDRKTTPFLERDGQYCGSPPSDDIAIREFERLRESGASFIVFTWLAFWWLDHYSGFYKYLRSKFQCVLRNERVVVFDLRRSF